jgi:hypothetical protein
MRSLQKMYHLKTDIYLLGRSGYLKIFLSKYPCNYLIDVSKWGTKEHR